MPTFSNANDKTAITAVIAVLSFALEKVGIIHP